MSKWFDLLNVLKPVILTHQNDTPVWVLESSGSYSVSSFYKLVNFGGIPSALKDYLENQCPTEHTCIFVADCYNKSMMLDNLAKRR